MSLAANLVEFGRILRRAGLTVTPEGTRLYSEAITLLGVDRKAAIRAAGRAIYVRRREDRETFDRAFGLFWRRYGPLGSDAPELPRMKQDANPPPTFPASTPPTDLEVESLPPLVEPALASEAERLKHADFASLTAAEARDALRMVARIRPTLLHRPSRRWAYRRSRGSRPAQNRMLRAALRTAGEPIAWQWRFHPQRPRPVALVCDISGSMERYSRLMLRFAHAVSQVGAPVEVFVFGTRLTRITRELRVRDPDSALARIGRTVVDWNGGTRIGESLHELNRRWVRRTIRSGAVVLIVSDGWERGDPDQLAAEMARLHRSCFRLYWLDPLAGQEGFEPAVAGLRAALPWIDALVPCGSVASLEELAARLAAATRRNRGR
ncbi:MAG: VWA domain-containing protein [Gemmatimonadales bacterium]